MENPERSGGAKARTSGPDKVVEEKPAMPEIKASAPTDGAREGKSGYASSLEHLWDEMARINHFIRAHTVRWRLTVGASKPEHLWGMIHVTDAEVEVYLKSPFVPPGQLPARLEATVKPFWKKARRAERAIYARRGQTPAGVTLRLIRLADLFGLSDFERDVLLVCLLPELDGRYRRLFAYLQDDASRRRPTVELVLEILHPLTEEGEMGRAVFARSAALRAHHLIDVEGEGGSGPLSTGSLSINRRIAHYLLGGDEHDDSLKGVAVNAEPLEWDDLLLVDESTLTEREKERLPAQQATGQRLQALARWWPIKDRGSVLFFHGPYGGGRLKAARALAASGGTPLLVVDVDAALNAVGGWERAVVLAYREAALQGAVLYWAGCEMLLDAERQPNHRWQALTAAAERFDGLSILASQINWYPSGQFQERPFLHVEFPMPGYKHRRCLWQRYLPPAGEFAAPAPDRTVLTRLLANSFQLTEGQIVDAVASARAQATSRDPQQPRLTVDDLYTGSRRQSGRRLLTMARRVEPVTDRTFDDLVLPNANRRQLDELRARIRHRHDVYAGLDFERRLSLGKGLIALFTGSSGTGKTMAAELLAREQGVDLYKVDLSAVVSKYVGETEKNLGRVFAEAEDANAIIFFDEADALFGKRGEVKEARDRWANIEINYLLQRIEEYAGVVILASNLRQNIDEAFMRRIHAIVEFPFPEAAARFSIWLGMFPESLTRPADEEIRELAERFRLSGGNIKNVVLDAAFRAVAADLGPPTITVRHLVLSIGREYQKLGKPITPSAFGETYYEWIAEAIL